MEIHHRRIGFFYTHAQAIEFKEKTVQHLHIYVRNKSKEKGFESMHNILLLIGIMAIIGSFLFYFLSLMNLAPIFLAAPLLFLSILATLWILNIRKQFKGF
jgi:hypothetical protein